MESNGTTNRKMKLNKSTDNVIDFGDDYEK